MSRGLRAEISKMSRVGKRPIAIPDGTSVTTSNNVITVEGSNGRLKRTVNNLVSVFVEGKEIKVLPRNGSRDAIMQSGTARSLINNMIQGVTQGFEKKLSLVGIGYRAKIQGNVLDLTLGFSHPVHHSLPKGVVAEVPTQTEILLKSIDKELLGKVAADIRSYRVPEAYKGKGIRYDQERVAVKDAKKK